ncbi:MAG TPA: long-chain fatty acid--CoA ligase [Clostridiales bacterium]|nr:long-chain fatty acid--CoA ligase [Clostridiales bacterium]
MKCIAKMRRTGNMKAKASTAKPWLKFYTEEALNAKLPEETLYEHVLKNNESHRGNIAINYFGNKISYGELLDTADMCAASFAELGIKTGDMVACCSATIPELAFALYGLNKLGAAMVALDPRRSPSEIKEFIVSSGANVLLLLDLAYVHLADMLDELSLEKVIIISADNYMSPIVKMFKQIKMPAPAVPIGGRTISWKEFLKLGKDKSVEAVGYGEFELAAVTLTGGTTGMPKGVMLSNDGFNAVAMDFRYCGVTYTRNQRFLDIIPAFSSYGIVASLQMPLSLGLEIVMIPKFDPDKVGKLVKKYKPSHTLLVPAHYEKLMNSKEMKNGFDLSFFRTAGSGGDTMNAGLESKLNGFLREHGCKFPLSQGYGMSEVSSAASCCCNGNFKSLSVGYPLLTTNVAIFKPGTTEELDYGEEGEVCISGPSVMLGYLNNSEETEKVMATHPDGTAWVHSGDLGCMDEDGFIFIKGRMKRMITRFDGHKIFPVQIESVIGMVSDVQSCAVVGVADTEHAQGMQALAVVKLRQGADETAVREILKEKMETELEDRGRPKFLHFVEEMPLAGMGKIDYNKLAADFNSFRNANIAV